jgi:16S rRNA (uracil1498-N3)-methyltransferase
MIEKASELGAARFVPVIADHTAVPRLNVERAEAQAVDAAEQCERLDIMAIDALQPLSALLADWPQDRTLYLALERSAAAPFAAILRDNPPPPAMALLIGPEGGFSPDERAHLLSLAFVQPVSLGPTILRAETAAIAGLAVLTGFLQAK